MLLQIIFITSLVLSVPGNASSNEDAVQSEIDSLRDEIRVFREDVENQNLNSMRSEMLRDAVLDVIAEAESRINLRGNTNVPWNEIRTTDNAFSLKTSFYMQYDWILSQAGNPQTTDYGFMLQRARITFTGNIIDPSWKYYLRLQIGSQGIANPEAAFIQKDLNEQWSIQAGLVYGMFSLSEAISNDEELGVNLSYVTGQFDEETNNGLVLSFADEKTRFWTTLSNGFGQTNVQPINNARMGIMFRGEYKPFGNWDDLYNFNPHPNSIEDGMLFGMGASYDWGTSEGNNPPATKVAGTATRLTTDFSWQTPGFSVMAAGYYQDWEQGGLAGGTRWAGEAQATGFLNSQLQLYGRYEWGTITDSDERDLSIVTVGTSIYPFEDITIKFSAEFIRSFGSTQNWATDGDVGFIQSSEPQNIIRTQLQLSF